MGRKPTHGQRIGLKCNKEYTAWVHMRQRCNNQKHQRYSDYGGRGITVCKRWMESFENFYEDMGAAPTKEHTLERIENNKGYSKENCRWATMSEQSRNTRQIRYLVFNGIKKSLPDWADATGVKLSTLKSRITKYGWSVEKALTTKP